MVVSCPSCTFANEDERVGKPCMVCGFNPLPSAPNPAAPIAEIAVKKRSRGLGADPSSKIKWSISVSIPSSPLPSDARIASVELFLPESYSPPHVILNSPPFKYVRKGWGSFSVHVVVTFSILSDPSSSLTLSHPVSIDLAAAPPSLATLSRIPLYPPSSSQPSSSSSQPSSSSSQPSSSSSSSQPSQPSQPVINCPNCTLENPLSSTTCSLCQSSLLSLATSSPPSASTASTATQWACRRCTFHNPATTPTCEACGDLKTKRPDGGTVGTPLPSPLPSPSTTLSTSSRRAFPDEDSTWIPALSTSELLVSDQDEAELRLANILTLADLPFTDPDFPPNDVSLYGPNMTESFKAVDTKELAWVRARTLATSSSSTRMFSHTVQSASSQDIIQGALGDCWFLSALAVVAEREGLLERIILTHEANEEGVYSFRFCMGGQWVVVTVDDYLPILASSRRGRPRLAYGRGRDRVLWVSLLEKAFAKANGHYRGIAGGTSTEALQALTGAPTIRVSLEETDEEEDLNNPGARDVLWARMLSWHESQFLVAMSCGRSGMGGDIFESVGLQSNHAYSLLQLRSHGDTRLLQLRNPWGAAANAEWNGDWSDHSPLWTDAVRAELGVYGSPADDGIFWMSLDDCLTYFGAISVCMLHGSWCEYRVPLSTEGSSLGAPWTTELHQVSISAPTWATFEIQQASQRGVDERDRSDYVPIGLVIARKGQNGNYGVVGSVPPLPRRTRVVDVLLDDPDGEYVCIPIVPDLLEMPRALHLSVHAARPVVLRGVPTSPPVVRRVLGALITSRGDPSVYGDGLVFFSFVWGSMYLLHMVNDSSNRAIVLNIDATGSDNIGSLRGGSHETLDAVGPHEQMTVFAGVTVNVFSAWSAAYRSSYRVKKLGFGRGGKPTDHQPCLQGGELFFPW